MFKKLNLHGDDPSKHGMRQSFTSATPNSRIVPGTATSPTQGFHAVGDETHHHHQQQQIPYDSSRLSATHYYNRDSSSTMYSTYDTRESYVDPVATTPAAGYCRETYIEPNTANVRHTQVGSTMSFNDSRRPSMNFFNDESSDSLTEFRDSFRVSSPEVPRVHQAESPIKMQQAYVNVPEPSSATIEPTETWTDSVAMKPSLSTGSARHPPPLPPLVIPPTPSRSTHLPHQQHHNQQQQASAPLSSSVSPQRANPPQLTPCTPASSRTSPMTSSPLAVSPRTPSPNTLQPPQPQASVSSPTSPKSPKRESASPMSETERLVGDGIKFHEAGQLEKATECFRQAAARDSPIGMFLYGVSLRHGWGCRRNEHVAFQYLQKAAEHAVMDLNSLSSTVNTSASKGELIIAIYELGVSFRHGWGCRKNKETAVYFFKIAADLGDPDAQNDLGHCYYHGHGVKKDLYMAAKYYRMADKQGHGIMGNSWIHKPKYDHPPSK